MERPPAILAIPAILEAEPIADAAHNRRIAKIAEGAKPAPEVEASPCDRGDPEQTALLSRDDLEPSQLAALGSDGLRGYARALSATMDACTSPADYTQAALCESCGPVWLWQGARPRLKGCPWCLYRKAGKSFARPHS